MSLALWGGLAGAGKGISDVGRQMELDALEERRQRNLAEIAAARDQSREDIAAMRGGRAGSSSGSRSGGSATGGNSLRDLMNDPEAMAFASGVDRGQIDDALAMARGQRPTREVEGDLPMDEEGNVMEGPGAPKTVDKYEPGKAAEVRMAGTTALRQAMKVADPKNADSLSDSERTDQGTKFAAEYRKGNDRAGEAALINDSKPAYDDGSSNATGKVTAGSLAEAKVKGEEAGASADKALAGKRSQETKTEIDKREGKGSIADRLKLIDAERKTIATDLADARALEKAGQTDMDLTAEQKAQRVERRRRLEEESNSLRDKYKALEARLDGADGTKPKADAPAPKPAPAASSAPPVAALKEGVKTTFKNGQTWTLRGGRPVQLN